MAGMNKAKKYDWKDSNLALFGSDLEKNVKKASAETEVAWKGAGQGVGIKIWRIMQFKVTTWPTEDYGKFYSGDSYIILNTYKKEGEEDLEYDVHFWIGKHSTQDEYGTAAYKTVELDTLLNDKPIQHREVQGHESDLFKSYFKEITLMKGGAESGFRHVKPTEYKPRLFQVKGERKNITVKQIPMKKGSITSDDVFILDVGLEMFQFNGEAANKDEKFRATQYIQTLKSERGGRATLEVLDERDVGPDHPFYKHFEAQKDEDDDDEDGTDEYKAKDGDHELYRLSDSTGAMTFKKEKKGPISKSDLDTNDAFIVDLKSAVYVWLGKGTSDGERKKAMQFAHKYLMSTDHPLVPVSCMKEGRESSAFNSAVAIAA